MRASRAGSPSPSKNLLDRVVVCPSGCWIWAGGTSGAGRGAGYGRILRPGTRNAMAAHRYVYETFVAPVPAGFQVDHVCRRWATFPRAARLCVRPDHLEAVTAAENQRRRVAAENATDNFAPLAPALPRPASIEAWRCIPDDDPQWIS